VPEHVPYVQAGCIVVAYDVSGSSSDRQRINLRAIREFMASDAGVKDGQRALDYALKNLPVDPQRVFAAGHSSAATIALQLAEADPRVKACVAYAPAVDVLGFLKDQDGLDQKIEESVPGFLNFIQRTSPSGNASALRQPLFLFHADDDDVVPLEPIRQLAAAVPTAKLVRVPDGGHYDSMLSKGIPAGIKWLRSNGIVQ
jgi:dipeptidyl aminopeptidase/acylaminoacyl peptidase